MIRWLINWLLGNKDTTKTEIKEPSKDNPQARYLAETLQFAKTKHQELSNQQAALKQKQREHRQWQQRHGVLHVDQLKKMDGVEFENYLAKLFEGFGFEVETTPTTGDYGADLLLYKSQQKIAVQAKCYSVGVSAVQEALSGMMYYQCHSAWVVTTGNFTANALELAQKSKVRLIGRNELGMLIVEMQTQTTN